MQSPACNESNNIVTRDAVKLHTRHRFVFNIKYFRKIKTAAFKNDTHGTVVYSLTYSY